MKPPMAVNLAVKDKPRSLLSQLALVAQRIEQRFPKPCVAGSSPAGGTTSEQRILFERF